MKKIKELYQKHGKKAFIIWVLWLIAKWTLFFFFGSAIWDCFN